MAASVTRVSGRRADDVRALQLLVRTITFSGTYATGGEVITAKSVGLFRILGVVALDSIVAPAGTATGSMPKFDVSADGKTVNIRFLRDAAGAAQAALGVELNNGTAHVASSKIDLLFIGE